MTYNRCTGQRFERVMVLLLCVKSENINSPLMQMVAEMTVLNAEYLESILGEHSIDLFYLLIVVG